MSVVPIIKTVGIGLGALFWNTILLIIGWAVARFGNNTYNNEIRYKIIHKYQIYSQTIKGLLGVTPEVPSNQILNYLGVALCALSGVFYLFIRSESQPSLDSERQHLLAPESLTGDEIIPVIRAVNRGSNINTEDEANEERFFVERLSEPTKRLLGISLSCIAGVLYGFTFTPALYVQDNYLDASQNALDYVFSLYTGIFLSSIFYFTAYCIFMKNKPKVYPRVVLPALVSG